MKVDVLKPGEVGPSERLLWWSYQQGDPRLANPFLSATFARLAGQVRPKVRVGVIGDGGTLAGFWAFGLDRMSVAHPVVRGFTGLQGIVHGDGLVFSWPEVLAQAGTRGAYFDHLVSYQAGQLPGPILMDESPFVDLSEGWGGYEGWLAEHHKRFASQNRNKWNKTEKLFGQAEFVAHDRNPDALATFFRLKSAQCRRNGWVDIFQRGWARDLVAMVSNAAEPDLQGFLSTLRLDGQVAAVCVALQGFGARCNWMLAYEPSFSWLRPGIQLTLRCIENAAEEGCASLSLGKGAERYKRTLCQGTELLGSGSVGAAGASGRLFSAATWPLRTGSSLLARSPALEDAARRRVRDLRRVRYARAST